MTGVEFHVEQKCQEEKVIARVASAGFAFCVPGLALSGAPIVAWCTIAPRTTTFTTVNETTAFRIAFLGTNREEVTALLPQGVFGKQAPTATGTHNLSRHAGSFVSF